MHSKLTHLRNNMNTLNNKYKILNNSSLTTLQALAADPCFLCCLTDEDLLDA